MTVTVYTKPACVQCNATYRALDKKGIAYQSVDISQDALSKGREKLTRKIQKGVETGAFTAEQQATMLGHDLTRCRV